MTTAAIDAIDTRAAGAEVLGVDYPSRTITVIVAPYDQPATVGYRGELWTEAFAPGPPQFLDLSTRKRQEQGSCALIGQDSAGFGAFLVKATALR